MTPFFYNQGFAYYDEGFILHAVQRLLQGEIPYADFDLIYTPGSIFLTAFVFKIFGESMLTGRIFSLLVSLLAGYLVYKITFKATQNNLAAILATLIYISWGPTHINFPWPSMFAITVGLVTIFVYPNYLLMGFFTFAVFFCKQNFGLAVFLTVLIQIRLIRRLRLVNLIRFISGFTIGLSLFLIYLLFTGSAQSFWNNFYFYSIESLLLKGVAKTVFPTGLKTLLYLFPFCISIATIFIFNKKSNLLLLPLFVIFGYIFGIRPTTDFVHLSVLMSISGLSLSLFINSKYKTIAIMFSFSLIFLGLHTALFKNYYRWDSPLVLQKYFVAHPRAGIYVDAKFNQLIPEVLAEIEKRTDKDDYLFIFPNAPLFYFLADRENPTRFMNMPNNLHTEEHEESVIGNLRNKKVKLILINENIQNSKYRVIKKYILDNYDKIKDVSEFSFWLKKPDD